MAQLYTVRMVSKKIISQYDGKGKKIGEREELIPQAYHDLPLVTAQTYKTKFPNSQVEIIAQAASFEPQHKARVRSGDEPRSKRPAPAKVPEPEVDPFAAAKSGDMTAAINAEIS